MASEQLKKLSGYRDFTKEEQKATQELTKIMGEALKESGFDFDDADDKAGKWDDHIQKVIDKGMRAISDYKSAYKEDIIESDIEELHDLIQNWQFLQNTHDAFIHDYLYAVAAKKIIDKDAADLEKEKEVYDDKIKAIDGSVEAVVGVFDRRSFTSTIGRLSSDILGGVGSALRKLRGESKNKWTRKMEEFNDEIRKGKAEGKIVEPDYSKPVNEFGDMLKSLFSKAVVPGATAFITSNPGPLAGVIKKDVVAAAKSVLKIKSSANLVERILKRRNERCEYIVKKCYAKNPVSELRDAIGSMKVKHPKLVALRKGWNRTASKVLEQLRDSIEQYDDLKEAISNNRYIKSKLGLSFSDAQYSDYIDTMGMELERLANELEDEIQEQVEAAQEELLEEAEREAKEAVAKHKG